MPQRRFLARSRASPYSDPMSWLSYLLIGCAVFALGAKLLYDAYHAHAHWRLALGYAITVAALLIWAWSAWVATTPADLTPGRFDFLPF